MKPGYKTTEFWLTTAATLLGLLLASGVLDDLAATHWAVKAAAAAGSLLAALGYTVSRGGVKCQEMRQPFRAPHDGGHL